ncbi:hypothetical protein IW261DRAFT_264055 [Armillaria novae-zelandiae]|uniref:Uncharacterized protein n=1 Tax=Armillaria novae-zelandiae TaxID=153914 RepID=A0AA39N8A7_9AGAR|nr:hypothetical protein IW261DRAFT_264055 [Armillaria novae-zelandiae]
MLSLSTHGHVHRPVFQKENNVQKRGNRAKDRQGSQDSESVQCQGTRRVRDGCCQSTHVWRNQKTACGYAIRERVFSWKPGCMDGCDGESTRPEDGAVCCRVGTKNVKWTRVIKSVCAVKVDDARTGKDGKIKLKDEEYTYGHKASQNAMHSGEAIRVIC